MTEAQRLAHDPEKISVKAICLDRCFVFMRRDIASFDENLFAEWNPDGVACHGGAGCQCVPSLDRSNHRRFICRRKNQLIPYPQRSGLDPARYDSAHVKTINVLNAKAQRKIDIGLLRLSQVESFENTHTTIPFHSHW